MKLAFVKMQGCGNDYIYIDCFSPSLYRWIYETSFDVLAKRLSNRHFGIGGDGIVLILPSSISNARMRMFNADGSEGSMCGNAIRCVAKYLYEKHLVEKQDMTIETNSGCKQIHVDVKDGFVTSVMVNMGSPCFQPDQIPVLFDGKEVLQEVIDIDHHSLSISCVSMGNPHAVIFHPDPNRLHLKQVGPAIERYDRFPDGINVEFVKVIDRSTLSLRVWERGSGETLACGTGACAAVVIACKLGYCDTNTDVVVHLRGGDLTIRYDQEVVTMSGPCSCVFEGFIELS